MLNGKYTKFLFMHLNRWKNYPDELDWTEDRLREKLKVPQNYNFSKIEDRILEKARKEIVMKTEIYFDYEIDRKSKAVQFKVYKLEEKLINARQMPGFERFVLQTKEQIKKITASPARWFGLHFSEVTVETVPLVLSDVKNLEIHERISEENQGES